ncbi:small GTP-binding protein [Histomonas meleagridis]|uniref:small GTP-binding protein n=1 Tax=Histomonas meleagridis TaxID=135588 RepID=UPI00355AC311|nr:small GTP-binding protein [Histomonas meleagridis]KAH0798671.1 small GTP-binding protein [Histomonas meleagridis]
MKSLSAKVVLLGDTSVGKTALLTRIVTDTFDESITPTVGASYSYKTIEVDDKEVKFQIWDTAGQERYRCLSPIYCRDAQIGLILYSIDDKKTFEIIDFWVSSLIENSGSNVLLFLIGNKSDLRETTPEEKCVTLQEGMDKAEEIHAGFYEVSAKTGSGVNELIQMVAQVFVESNQSHNKSKTSEEAVGVDIANAEQNKNKGCCGK